MKLSLNALYSTLLEDLMPFLPTEFYGVNAKTLGSKIETSVDEEVRKGDLHPKTIASLALLESVFKKYTDVVAADANDKALEKFLLANDRCGNWQLKTSSLLEDHLVGEFKLSLNKFFIPSNAEPSILAWPDEFFELGGLGPGASVGSRGTDFYTKLFDGPLSTTSSGLYHMYRRYISTSNTLLEAESGREERFGEYPIVAGSKLSFVPKKDDISRVICTEPVLNMWAQKGVGELIARRLKRRYGIDLSTQPAINRELARIGSIDNDLSTIDLSSASDSIGLLFCREFLPRPVMDVLEALRCERTEVNPKDILSPSLRKAADTEEGWLALNMISSMGNGFTFPLETAIFACAVEAVYRVFDIPMRKSKYEKTYLDGPFGLEGVFTRPSENKISLGNFGVFGDDIICKADVAHHVVRLLEICGFTTNASKSFVRGPFRESCGGDYYRGFPVRGVFIKDLSSQASRYVAINRLNRWSAVTGISLSRTVRLLVSKVRKLPVPLHENDDAGIKVTHAQLRKLIRLNKPGQRVSDPTCLDTCEGGPTVKGWDLRGIMRNDDTGAYLYKRWLVNPTKLRFLEDAVVTPKGARTRHYNAAGALSAYLHGNIEGGTVAIRHDRVRYLTKLAQTPCWDFVPTAGSQDPVGAERWDSALWLNLMI